MGHSDGVRTGGNNQAPVQDPTLGKRGTLLTSIVAEHGKFDGEPVNNLKPKDKSEAAFIRCMAQVYQVDEAAVKDALEGKVKDDSPLKNDADRFKKMHDNWVKGATVKMFPSLNLDGLAKAKPPPAKDAPVPSGAKKDDKPVDVKPPAEAVPSNDPKVQTDYADKKIAELTKSLPPDILKKYNLQGLYDKFHKSGGESTFNDFYKACRTAEQEAKNGPPKKDAAPPKAVDAPPAKPAGPSLPAKEGNADQIESKFLKSSSEPGGGGNGFVLSFNGLDKLDAAGKEKEFNQVVASLYGIKESDVPAYCASNTVLARAHDKWLGERDATKDFRLTFPQKLQGAGAPAGAPPAAPGAPAARATLEKLAELPPDLRTKESRAKLTEVDRQRATSPLLASLGVPTKDGDFLTTRAYVYGVQELVGVGVPDGLWGPETQEKVDAYLKKSNGDVSAFKPKCDAALVKAQAQEREMRAAINAALDKVDGDGQGDHSTWWSKDPRATSNDPAVRAAFRQEVYKIIANRLQHQKPGEKWQEVTDGVLKKGVTDDDIEKLYGQYTVDKQSTTALNKSAETLINASHDGRPWQQDGPFKYTQADYDKAITDKAKELARSNLSDAEKAKELEKFAAKELEGHIDGKWQYKEGQRVKGNDQNQTYWASSDVGNQVRGTLTSGNQVTDEQKAKLDTAIKNLEGKRRSWAGTEGDANPTDSPDNPKHKRNQDDADWKLGELYATRNHARGGIAPPIPEELQGNKEFVDGYNKTIVKGRGLQVTLTVPEGNYVPKDYKHGRG